MKTAFGAFLDPVVDKLLVAVVLVLLSTRPVPVGQFAGNTWILPITASRELPALAAALDPKSAAAWSK